MNIAISNEKHCKEQWRKQLRFSLKKNKLKITHFPLNVNQNDRNYYFFPYLNDIWKKIISSSKNIIQSK